MRMPNTNHSMCLVFLAWMFLITGPLVSQKSAPLKIGMIGLDTSHVIAFTSLLNDSLNPDHVPGACVVAAFKGGSPDLESSASRVEGYTTQLREKWGIEIVNSIETLCTKVDAVMLMSVDGRPHLSQVRPVFAAKKRVFIDKPFTAGVRDALEIVRLSRESGTPFFSSSSLRFVDELQAVKKDVRLGGILGAFTWGPAPLESHHPDLFWYGIHAVEMLYTIMGPGCEAVTRVRTDGADLVVGRWKDGRLGTVRGIRDGERSYGAVVFGNKANVPAPIQKVDYRGLVVEIVKFFRTGIPPVPPEETLEIMAFMEAADLSKVRQGALVALGELIK